MNITISDPNPKTSDDVTTAYQNGYNQYPIDHPADVNFIDIMNLASGSIYVYSYDGSENLVAVVAAADFGRFDRQQFIGCTELRFRTRSNNVNIKYGVASFGISDTDSPSFVNSVLTGLNFGDLVFTFNLVNTHSYGIISLTDVVFSS